MLLGAKGELHYCSHKLATARVVAKEIYNRVKHVHNLLLVIDILSFRLSVKIKKKNY